MGCQPCVMIKRKILNLLQKKKKKTQYHQNEKEPTNPEKTEINRAMLRYNLWNRTDRLDSSTARADIAIGEAGFAMQTGAAVSVNNTSSTFLKKKQRDPLNREGKTKWVIEWRGKRTLRAEEEWKRKWKRRSARKKWRLAIESRDYRREIFRECR